jgi:hypothetical protein
MSLAEPVITTGSGTLDRDNTLSFLLFLAFYITCSSSFQPAIYRYRGALICQECATEFRNAVGSQLDKPNWLLRSPSFRGSRRGHEGTIHSISGYGPSVSS